MYLAIMKIVPTAAFEDPENYKGETLVEDAVDDFVLDSDRVYFVIKGVNKLATNKHTNVVQRLNTLSE